MRLLYDLPTPLIVLALFGVMVAAVEGAQRLGMRRGAAAWQSSRDVLVTLSGATLALLGLMLAFSFSLAVDRFHARQAVLVREANAIAGVALLAELLEPESLAAARALLREYAEQRIAFLTVGHDAARERAAVEAARAAHARIWPLVTALESYREPQAANLASLSRAVVDMGTVAREREVARSTRVPEPVLVMLFVLAILAGATVAYTFGASGHRGRAPTLTFLLLVCMVVYVVIDLDRPRRGLMHLDPAPLRDALALVDRAG